MSQVCIHCKRATLKRSSRHGVAERFVYSLLGYYPWRCTYCGERELLRDRGESRRRSMRMHAKREV